MEVKLNLKPPLSSFFNFDNPLHTPSCPENQEVPPAPNRTTSPISLKNPHSSKTLVNPRHPLQIPLDDNPCPPDLKKGSGLRGVMMRQGGAMMSGVRSMVVEGRRDRRLWCSKRVGI